MYTSATLGQGVSMEDIDQGKGKGKGENWAMDPGMAQALGMGVLLGARMSQWSQGGGSSSQGWSSSSQGWWEQDGKSWSTRALGDKWW